MFLFLCFLKITYLSLSLLCQMSNQQLACLISSHHLQNISVFRSSTLADLLNITTENSTLYNPTSNITLKEILTNSSISDISIEMLLNSFIDNSTLFEIFNSSITISPFSPFPLNTNIPDITLEKLIYTCIPNSKLELKLNSPDGNTLDELLDSPISDITLEKLHKSSRHQSILKQLLNSIFNNIDFNQRTRTLLRLVTLVLAPVSKAVLGLIGWSVALLTIDR